MDAALRRNSDFASKPCVLQHFGSPPFNSITSKYCKGYKFHKKEDFKMLKNRGAVPGPVTLFITLYIYTLNNPPFFFIAQVWLLPFGTLVTTSFYGSTTTEQYVFHLSKSLLAQNQQLRYMLSVLFSMGFHLFQNSGFLSNGDLKGPFHAQVFFHDPKFNHQKLSNEHLPYTNISAKRMWKKLRAFSKSATY